MTQSTSTPHGESHENTQQHDQQSRLHREQASSGEQHDAPFFVVGVGASAGGLKAFETFFETLPDEPGMAFVVIQHLDPHHESELAEILQNHTAMMVTQIQGQEQVQPNTVYIIPPGFSLSLKHGVLLLSEPKEPRDRRVPIDLFFRSLAKDQGDHAVCVILSGTGSDGTLGLKSIKEENGVVMVQSPDSAEYTGMPRSAITTGLVDLVANVDELAEKLVEYQQSAGRLRFTQPDVELPRAEADILQRIFAQLDGQINVDFSHYKRSTVLRRLQRRMQVNQIAGLESYLTLLRTDHDEVDALFKDLLISVTNFFRDDEVWLLLAQKIIPALFDRLAHPNDQIRVWVPGCATGEEAYSLAMLLLEEAGRRNSQPHLQIFATDLNSDALAFARRGLYPEAIAADVTPERLQRFFQRDGTDYKVHPSLQEIVLFAPHNLNKDAPFARLDLISCRNLLIYLERTIQLSVFQIFHFALKEDGYLLLGSSESAEQAQEYFEAVDKRQRIYKARSGRATMPQLPINMMTKTRRPDRQNRDGATKQASSLSSVHQQLMLQRYAPPSVIVDQHYEIRYKFGDVGHYLRHHEGKPSLNLLDNISDQIRVELRTALFSVLRRQEAIRPRRLRLTVDGAPETLLLHVEPIHIENHVAEPLLLVIFEALPEPDVDHRTGRDIEGDPSVVQQLENELQELRHRMQTTVEEYETSNEELRSSNEELQSMNEELRSTSEELETSREELRSTSEELQSMNQELKYKIEDLNQANSDLENLIEATNIATLFLDQELSLKRYTPVVTTIFHIIPSDVGRPFSHISHKIDHGTLPGLAEKVLHTLETVQEEVKTQDGRWFLLQMRPYRTVQNYIEGVVITLVDISVQLHAEQLAETRATQQAVVAELGMSALRGMPFDELIDVAVRQIAAILDVEYTKILQLHPDDSQLQLVAGVGWEEGLVGTALVDGGTNSQAGFTLHSDKPVIVEDLATEKRFHGPALLTDHDVVSGISVVISQLNRPYGVLGAHSRQPRQFTHHDADFLQGIANILGTAIERQRAENERNKLVQELRALTETLERRVEERTQTLRTRGEQLSAMASALTVAEQRERERISQILHDDLQQLIFGSQMRVLLLEEDLADSAELERLREGFQDVVQLHQQAISIVRSLTVELSPPILDNKLSEAFKWLAGHMHSSYGLRVELISEDDAEPANKDLRELAFQIIRELLFNVVKHAGVDQVRLLLREQNGRCVITVADNGKGFDVSAFEQQAAKNTGYGLHSVRERLNLFDGSLIIDSTPGAGTRVTVSLPGLVKRDDHSEQSR